MAERPHGLLDDDQVLTNLRLDQQSLVVPACAADLTDLITSCWKKCDYDRPSFSQLNHLLCQRQQLMSNHSDHYQPTI
jgi:hypothetical protein